MPATDGEISRERTKGAFLAEHFSATGFDYVGDSAADLKVWRHARGAYVLAVRLVLSKRLS